MQAPRRRGWGQPGLCLPLPERAVPRGLPWQWVSQRPSDNKAAAKWMQRGHSRSAGSAGVSWWVCWGHRRAGLAAPPEAGAHWFWGGGCTCNDGGAPGRAEPPLASVGPRLTPPAPLCGTGLPTSRPSLWAMAMTPGRDLWPQGRSWAGPSEAWAPQWAELLSASCLCSFSKLKRTRVWAHTALTSLSLQATRGCNFPWMTWIPACWGGAY